MENFKDYKNAIQHEILTANYFLSSKDALDYINIFTNILYDYYLQGKTVNEVCILIMSYEPTIK